MLPGEMEALLNAEHGAPFKVLGAHRLLEGTALRVLLPGVKSVSMIVGESKEPLRLLDPAGFFEGIFPDRTDVTGYRLEIVTAAGETTVIDDPYAFPPLLTDFDLHLLGQGHHLEAYNKLGAHIVENLGVHGVSFAVWAPNARRVSVVGDWNGWNAVVHPMHRHESGIWELFIPSIGQGNIYKYDILSNENNYRIQKSDPVGFYAELRPKSGSVVFDIEHYTWKDSAWMAARASANPLTRPYSIYEVHLGSWRRPGSGKEFLSYDELARQLAEYAVEMAYTHIQLMPVSEHPLDMSWGYQTIGYFAPTSRFGTPIDFMHLVDTLHASGVGVLLDWVPAHFPRDGHGLAFFDGTHLYEHADPRQGTQPDWGTLVFNFGRSEVRNFLLSNALYWLDKYHIDGLRVDAVASMIYLNFSRKDGEWIPNQYGSHENLEAVSFLRELNETIHLKFPGAVTIAEESTSWPMVSRPTYLGGLGFTFKWNMGWMHDTLEYLAKDPIHRLYHHNLMTFSLMYAFSENFVLALSHDEVVHMKGSFIQKASGDYWQKFATLRAFYGMMWAHPGKKHLFMGGEFGQWREWNEAASLDWHLLDFPIHHGLQTWVRDLNRLYKTTPALYEVDFEWQGFEWIEPNDAAQSVYSFVRRARDPQDFIVFVVNFTPVPRYNYRIGVPEPGYYAELLNSDAQVYGGSGVGNGGGLHTEAYRAHNREHSLNLTVPPLGAVILKRTDHR